MYLHMPITGQKYDHMYYKRRKTHMEALSLIDLAIAHKIVQNIIGCGNFIVFSACTRKRRLIRDICTGTVNPNVKLV